MSGAGFMQVHRYAPHTRRRYDRAISVYRRDAALAGVEPTAPARGWFHDWLRLQIEQHSLRYARQLVVALRHHFRSGVLGALINEQATRDVLQFSRYIGAPALEIDRCGLPAGHAQVQAFAAAAYHPNTIRQYSRNAERWETYAEQRDVDPTAASEGDILRFLDSLVSRYSYRHVRNVRSAISYYLRCAGAPDVARAKAVDEMLEALHRMKPPRPAEAHGECHVRSMLLALGEEPLDLRDRILILICFFTGLSAGKLRLLDTGCWQIEGDFILLDVPGAKRPFCCARIDDPVFNLEFWLQRWVKLIPAGPLFPAMTARGGWTKMATCELAIRKALSRAARRGGLSERSPMTALKKGLIHETVPVQGALAVAHHLQYRSAGSIETHFPVLHIKARAHRRRSGGGFDVT